MKDKIIGKRLAVRIKNKSTKKILLLLSLIAISFFTRAQSPDSSHAPKWAFYQVNPLGLITKEKIKVERRLNPANSISLAYTKFHGFSTDNQVFGEYRHYNSAKGRTEFFLYGKAGFGAGTTIGFETANSYGPYKYVLAGGGSGWHVSIGKKEHFFFDISMGLKYTGVINNKRDNIGSLDPETTFYLFGAGSPVDISACFGWQIR